MLAPLLTFNLSALALVRPQPLRLVESLVLLLLHLVGTSALLRLMSFPLWLAPLLLAPFLGAAFVPRIASASSILAPLFFAYAALLIRFVFIRMLRGDVLGYFEYTLPDPRVLLHFEFIVASALLYGMLIAAALVLNARSRALGLASVVTAGAILGWAVAEYFGHRTFGATGSDPFAYVQMGVDLAARVSPAHRFEIFPLVAPTKLSWYPLLHVGYRLPFDVQGDAITVWSPAGSLAYAVAYRVGGERALYGVNPFFSVLGALASGLLAWELMRGLSKTLRVTTACATLILVATSKEIVDWAGVTMVDTQALVFSTLAVYAALRIYRTGAVKWAVLAGIFWGAAYAVRHTQLVIAVAFVPLFWFSSSSRHEKNRNLCILLLFAFLVALPDLWYHKIHLGNWLHPESEELALFSLDAIPSSLAGIGQSALVGAEFGWLVLFVVLGVVAFTRRERATSAALLLWLGASLAIHLPYAALRLRDLIPELPVLAFYASFGATAAIAALWRRQRAGANLSAAFLLFIFLELNLVRVWNTLPRVIESAPPRFGAMTQNQRAAFDALARLTPADALIGASLNSGAIELYAGRTAFRPADWSSAELREFFRVTQDRIGDLYLVEDNASLERVLEELRSEYRIARVTTLDVPLFGDAPISNGGALWKITR